MYFVTYAPEYQIVLSRRCPYACGYCNFPQTASPLPPSRKALRRLIKTAQRLGATQITFAAGEDISEVPEIANVCKYYGYNDWWDYLRGACEMVLETRYPRPMMPLLEVGAIPPSQLRRLRETAPVVRLMLDSGDEKLLAAEAHLNAPQKAPARRLSVLEDLGKWELPVSTGIIVGIGEEPASWARAARVVSGIHKRHSNIQSFVLQAFTPLPFSPMALHAPVTDGILLRAATEIRAELAADIPLTIKLQNRLHLAAASVRAGASDFGAIRLGSSERIEFAAYEDIDDAKATLARYGVGMVERTALMDNFARSRYLPEAIANSYAAYDQFRAEAPHADDTAVYG